MAQRTWLITGVSSGFGRELTEQLLERGDRVVGTVRDTGKVADLREHYPETFRAEVLDMTDTAAIREVVERSFAQLGRIEVIISNAGYGLFGAAEEFTDEQVEHIVATNLVGPIQLIRVALPHLRAQGGGRIIQMSSSGGRSSGWASGFSTTASPITTRPRRSRSSPRHVGGSGAGVLACCPGRTSARVTNCRTSCSRGTASATR
jgi:NAD(P)-dependent dehydrogenase (short-subunit alcohol dehydrogenase family)